MITCRWSIACEHAVVDRYTNNVSLLHIIDQITVRVPPEPASPIPISLDVMTLWERGDAESPESGESRTVIVTPQGEEVSHTATRVDLTEHQRLRSRLRVLGLPFHGYGKYQFRVDLMQGGEWQAVGAAYVDVVEGEVSPS